MKSKAIIVDIDGTLAIMKDRSPYAWHKVGQDTVNEAVKMIVNAYNGIVIIFSGRDSICRLETIQWLKENEIKYDALYMRDHKNYEKDSIIKERMYNEHIKDKYDIDFILDDRLQVCRMWYSLGLPLLRVGDPDADF